MYEQYQLFKKHPRTTFINAHFGWYGNDLAKLSEQLAELPNVYVEFGAVINELGRQPNTARRFFEDYQDRILFGKDIIRWMNITYIFKFLRLMMSTLNIIEKDMVYGGYME